MFSPKGKTIVDDVYGSCGACSAPGRQALHYKEITDVRSRRPDQSVGKSPRDDVPLAALVKKGDKENPLIRVKPGVFALREWDKETIEKGLQDRTPALERLAQAFGDQDVEVQETGDEEAVISAGPEPSRPSRTEMDEEEALPPDEDELRRAEIAARATEILRRRKTTSSRSRQRRSGKWCCRDGG